jgi:hypothetical protein
MGETRYKTDVAMTPVYRAFYEDAAKIEAVSWLIQELSESKSCFDVGTIILEESASKRCENCTCNGVWAVREYSVRASGIVEDNALEPPCDESSPYPA